MNQKELELAFLQKIFTNEEDQNLLEIAKEDYFKEMKGEIKIFREIYLKLGKLDQIALGNKLGYQSLVALTETVPSYMGTSAETILTELKERYSMERFITIVGDVYRKSLAGEVELNEAIAMIEQTSKLTTIEDSASELKDLFAQGAINARERKEETGIRTGIENIDNILKRGILPHNYVVIGARPGCGKTALALQIAINNLLNNKRVLYITMEMGDSEIVEYRIMENLLDMTYEEIEETMKSPKPTKNFLKIQSMQRELNSLKGMIFETKIKNDRDLMKKIKTRLVKEKLDLIVVDYIGLVRPAQKSTQSREREVTDVSENLKAITSEYQVPIICLTQLNRGGADGEPSGSNIRESDSLLQDANKVLLLWNNVEESEKLDGNNTVVECKVEKNREGGQGVTELLFKKDIQKIVSYDNPNLRK